MQVGFIGSGNMAAALARRWGDPVLAAGHGTRRDHRRVARAPVRGHQGSVPALWALIAEAWTDTAIRHGMPAPRAATLVTETMAGTAALLTQTDALALRRPVASPGATTARGLNALEQGGVRAALANAMDAVVG
jgi:pyrroline-5-carboxylate reductase